MALNHRSRHIAPLLWPLSLVLIFLVAAIDAGGNGSAGQRPSAIKQHQPRNDELTANDEEANEGLANEDAAVVSHLIERQLFANGNAGHFGLSGSGGINQDASSSSSILLRNCSYTDKDVFCDCDPILRRFVCRNVQKVNDIRRAFEHLLNVTRLVYWSRLEIHCIEPYTANDGNDGKESTAAAASATGTGTTVNKSFHISYEMFTEGPRFEAIIFVGDCAKPRHYDNLITVDRDVRQIVMIRNMLRMATSCSLLQPKFERLDELVLRDCVVAGDMISATFSTRCLGQYGTRNEPMQLSKLTISACNISLVEGGAFYNFAELELIDLSHNQISHLSRQAFAPHLYRLRTLKLDHNRLTSLAGEFFEKLPELREVILSGNRLTTLPALPSAGPGVAQVLHLADNPWDCRCRLIWILDEPMDSVRIISDEPRCTTPVDFQNRSLFKGLVMVKETFC